jgi:glycyl-tRNA synthetase beta chain
MSHELFIEVRCEELPARFIDGATRDLSARIIALLKGVSHGAVTTWSTPRRLAVAVADVAPGRPLEEKLVTGPPERAAFRDGAPTRAATGFARGRGVSVDDLIVVDGPKGRVVAARVQTGGEQTADLVSAGLEAAILGINFPKSMRWGSGTIRWARPIHGVTALYGGASIAATVIGAPTVTETSGHRLTPGPIAFTDSATWAAGLRAHNVEPDVADRRAEINAQLRAAAAALGAEIRDWDLVDEVVHLVEWPIVVTASFGEDLLELPPRLLVESMKVHQRVFPLYIDGTLDHHFLVVSNQPFAREADVSRTIAEGNRRVLTARFYDARFFYAEDRRKGLEASGDRLAGMQWIRKGGTMADKADRIAALAEQLAPRFGADSGHARRAGALCKNDLATQMVGEFPKLQGHVGNLLAVLAGEPAEVALALEEHYLPRYQGDQLPTSPTGLTLAVADRLDTLVGCFQLGLKPKGSADPLGLRRAAIGLLLLMLHSGTRAPLSALIETAAPEGAEGLEAFIMARARALLTESFATELVAAVMATGDSDIVALRGRLSAMASLAATPDFGPLKTTFKRVMGLTKAHDETGYDPGALQEDAEQSLHAAFSAVRDQARANSDALRYDDALTGLAGLKPAVDRLFDDVLVMTEDMTVRNNRLSLLRAIADEFRRIADFTQLSAEA